MRTNRAYFIFALIVVLLLTAVSCAPARRPLPEVPPADEMPAPDPNPQPTPAPNQAANSGGKMEIDRLEMAVEEMVGVERANVIVMNNTVLCGVKMAGGNAGGRVDAVRQDIEKVVKEVKPNTGTVAVAFEGEPMGKINRLAQEIKAGKPAAGLTDEINQITSQLNPNANQ